MSARYKTEQALQAVLEDHYSGLVYRGTRGHVKEFPCVVVATEGGEEIPLGSGNTMIDVTVTVQDQIDEAGEPNSTKRFDAAVLAVQDALRYSDLDDQMNRKGEGITVYGVTSRSGPETVYDDQEGFIAEVHSIGLYIGEVETSSEAEELQILTFDTGENVTFDTGENVTIVTII